jgi:hypothetical protein
VCIKCSVYRKCVLYNKITCVYCPFYTIYIDTLLFTTLLAADYCFIMQLRTTDGRYQCALCLKSYTDIHGLYLHNNDKHVLAAREYGCSVSVLTTRVTVNCELVNFEHSVLNYSDVHILHAENIH